MKNLYRFCCFASFALTTAFNTFAQNADLKCHTPDPVATPELRRIMQQIAMPSAQSQARMKAKPLLECLVAVDVASDVYTLFNKDTSLIKERIYYTFAEVSKVFEAEIQVKLTVSFINIWKEKSPYQSATDDNSYLFSMDSWWRNNRQNVPHQLLLGYSMKTGGLASYIPGQMGYASIVGVQGSGDFSIQTTAHELGHSFSSLHTHDCVWPGGQIDRCAGNCSTPETQDEVGTIMSYCGFLTMTFHPLCREVMRMAAEAKPLAALDVAPATPALVTGGSDLNRLDGYLSWKYVTKAQNYRLQLATDAAFTGIHTDTLLTAPQYHAVNLAAGSTYFWRVKAVNAVGESVWSAVGRLGVSSDIAVYAPLPKYPVLNSINGAAYRFEWYPVPGVNEYRLQFGPNEDFPALTTTEQLVTNASAATIIPTQFVCQNTCPVYWRIKAIRNGVESDWSPPRYFTTISVLQGIEPNSALSSGNRYQTSLPISYNLIVKPNSFSRFEVSTQPEFSSLVWQKEQLHNTTGQIGFQYRTIVMPENLMPNTAYYYRVQQTYGQVSTPWIMGRFTTGSDQHRWSYYNAGNSPLPPAGTQGFRLQPNNVGWFATTVGLFNTTDFKTWTVQSVKSTNGMLPGGLTDVAVDSENKLWVVGDRSLGWFDGTAWQQNSIRFPDGGQLRRILFDHKGMGYLVGGFDLYQFDRNGAITKLFTEPVLPRDIVTSGVIDRNNHLWTTYAASERGVGHFDGVDWTFINSSNSNLPAGILLSDIAVDTSGLEVWVAGRFGVAKWQKSGAWEITSLATMAPNGDETVVTALAFDQKNQLYALGEKNIYWFDGTKWQSFGTNFLTLGLSETKLTFDADHRLLIRGLTYGLSIYDGRTFRPEPLVATRYCVGGSVKVDFTPNFVPKPGITYRAELSDPTGLVFKSVPATFKTGSATVSLPAESRAGSAYKIRIVSDNPTLYGDESTTFTVVGRPVAAINVDSDTTVFAPDVVKLNAITGPGYTYQWLKDTTLIPGATMARFEANTSGLYRVRVTSAEGCSTVSSAVLATVQSPLGTSSLSADADMVLLPNPVEETCRIVFRQSSRSATELTLVDATGRNQLRRRLQPGQTQIELQLRNLPGGVYFVTAETKQKKLVGRLVKK
jgi:hypothetical protein